VARILIVEAEKNIRELFALELSEQGHDVIPIESCCNLAKKIQLFQPDLLVLGIKQIDLNGKEIFTEIHSFFKDLPIIIWTSCNSQKHQTAMIETDYYVIKHYDLTELKAKIKVALEARDYIFDRAIV
jgi:DNA-binding response OmpR family regulator